MPSHMSTPALIGHDIAYPAMLTLLPHGLLGLLVASLLAAYISTMSTHLNWGASYLVNDLYRRFMKPDANERHYVAVSRWVTCALMVLAGTVVFYLDTARDAFDLLLSIGAGTGLIYLLRWYWWRINAWSEISAMSASMATAMWLGTCALSSAERLLISVGSTTFVWWLITMITPPADATTLARFYDRIRPAGPGWRRVRRDAGLPTSTDRPAEALLGTTAGCAMVYAILFGTGYVLYGRHAAAVVCGLVAVVAGTLLVRSVRAGQRPAHGARRRAD